MTEKASETSPGAAAVVLSADDIVGEGFGSHYQQRTGSAVSETVAQSRDYLTFQQGVLLILRHCLKLVVRIYIRLDYKDFEILCRLLH